MLSYMKVPVQLSSKNPILLPKSGQESIRVKIELPYLNNADALFVLMNQNTFQFEVDLVRFTAVLNQELTAPFKIVPGSAPLIEICLEIYADSVDVLYHWKSFNLIFEYETTNSEVEQLPMNWEQVIPVQEDQFSDLT